MNWIFHNICVAKLSLVRLYPQKFHSHGNINIITSETVVKREPSFSPARSENDKSKHAKATTSTDVSSRNNVQIREDDKEELNAEFAKLKESNGVLHQANLDLHVLMSQLKEENGTLSRENTDLKEEIRNLTSQIECSLKKSSDEKEDDVYEVERLMNHRLKGKKWQFFVRWEGFDSTHDSWVEEKNLQCPQMLIEYKKENNLVQRK